MAAERQRLGVRHGADTLTLYVGLLNLATFIPIAILSVPGGVLADRYDRRAIVIATSALSVVFGTVITVAAQSSTGILVTGVSVGAVAGVLGFGFVTRRMWGHALLVVTFVLQAAGLVGTVLARTEWLSTLFTVPIGLGFAINIPILGGTLLRLSPDDLRGRVMSFYNVAMIGMRPLFSVTVGALGAVLSPVVVLLVFVAFPIAAIRLIGMTHRVPGQSGAAA